MSDVTVGPIQTYSDDSLLSSSTTTSQPVVQNNVSVTLTDSDLWLVDTSKLNAQTESTTSSTAFLTLDPAAQDNTTFENVTMQASSPLASSALESNSSSLQTSLPQGNSLMLAEVTGGTQLSSDGVSTMSTGSGVGSTGGSIDGASGSLSAGGSGGGTAFVEGGMGTASASDSSSLGQFPETTQTTATGVTQATSSQPSTGPPPPVPVPFEVSPTVGVLLMLAIFGCKLMVRKIAFKPKEAKQLDLKSVVS